MKETDGSCSGSRLSGTGAKECCGRLRLLCDDDIIIIIIIIIIIKQFPSAFASQILNQSDSKCHGF